MTPGVNTDQHPIKLEGIDGPESRICLSSSESPGPNPNARLVLTTRLGNDTR